MSLLQPAEFQQPAAKVGIFGSGGAGKTVTASLLAVGLSKTYHNAAPVAFFDTEDQSDFVIPIFQAEGVELRVVKSRAFVDMRTTHREALAQGCCVMIGDSYTHPYAELVESLKEKFNLRGRRLQFQHRDELDFLWNEWVREFRASAIHCIFAGRLAHEWGEEEDEAGDPRAVKLGTKMKGEGGAGYEPNMLIEVEAVHERPVRDRKTRSKKSGTTHTAYVLKDRLMALNGRQFSFRDLNGYKTGDYAKVFDSFRPHFDKLNIGVEKAPTLARSSVELFATPSMESAYESRKRRVNIAVEEIKGILGTLWPGSDNTSKLLKLTAHECLFETRSETKIETLAPEFLETAVQVLKYVEAASADGDNATTPAALMALIQTGKDWVKSQVVECVL